MTIELLATMDLGWSRTDVAERRLSPEDKVTIEEKMHELLKGIVMMSNPFQKVSSGQKPSNERNLDLVQQHVVDSGCNVWFADLWDRCIDADPLRAARAAEDQGRGPPRGHAAERREHLRDERVGLRGELHPRAAPQGP